MYITTKQWENYAKTLETKNLKKYHTSRTATTISNLSAAHCLIEVFPNGMRVTDDWKEVMKNNSIAK